jgi:hypothetical protein
VSPVTDGKSEFPLIDGKASFPQTDNKSSFTQTGCKSEFPQRDGKAAFPQTDLLSIVIYYPHPHRETVISVPIDRQTVNKSFHRDTFIQCSVR